MEPNYSFNFDILLRESTEQEQLDALSAVAGQAMHDLIHLKWKMQDNCLNFHLLTRITNKTPEKLSVVFQCFNLI